MGNPMDQFTRALLTYPSCYLTRFDVLQSMMLSPSWKWRDGEIVPVRDDSRTRGELKREFFDGCVDDFHKKELRFRLSNISTIAERKFDHQTDVVNVVRIINAASEDSPILNLPYDLTPYSRELISEFIEIVVGMLYEYEGYGSDRGLRQCLIDISNKVFPRNMETLTAMMVALGAADGV